MSSLCLSVAGETLTLLPSGALWMKQRATLLVADLHFGKAQHFRRLGVPVPHGTTDETLRALSADLQATAAQTLVVLGDLVHARPEARTLEALQCWRDQHPDLRWKLVLGNHDRHLDDLPQALQIELAAEGEALGPFALCHQPQTLAQRYVLAGHWHPCVSVRGRGRERLRLPCFWFGAAARPVGVLPAYGAFTGMHAIELQPGDRVAALAGEAVYELPLSPKPITVSPSPVTTSTSTVITQETT